MKPQKKVSKSKMREFEKIAAKNRVTAKRIAKMRQDIILSFARPSTREGVHSSLVIPPNNVIELHKRRKSASRLPGKGDPAKQRPESFRYQIGFMVPRFQKSSRYMQQVAKAKREHLSEVEELIRDSKRVKAIDNDIAKFLTLGDMNKVASLRKARESAVKKIRAQHVKAQKAKGKVVAATNAAINAANEAGTAGLGELPDFGSMFGGALSDIGVSLKETLQTGITGVIQAKTAAEIAKTEMDAQRKLMELQLKMQQEIAKNAPVIPAQSPVASVVGTATAAVQAPWYRNPLVIVPAAIGGYLLLKK